MDNIIKFRDTELMEIISMRSPGSVHLTAKYALKELYKILEKTSQSLPFSDSEFDIIKQSLLGWNYLDYACSFGIITAFKLRLKNYCHELISEKIDNLSDIQVLALLDMAMIEIKD